MNIVINVGKAKVAEVKELFLAEKELLKQVGIPYGTQFRFNGFACNVYSSGKVMFQGSGYECILQKVTEKLGLTSKYGQDNSNLRQSQNSVLSPSEDIFPIVGSDETGKGERVGPLVVTSCIVTDSEAYNKLLKLGVVDSKTLSKNSIIKVTKELRELERQGVIRFETVVVSPQEYNRMHRETKNVNIMLARLHSKSILDNIIKLYTENNNKFHDVKLYIDKFSVLKNRFTDVFYSELARYKEKYELFNAVEFIIVEEHKGERFPAVAAASIVAKAVYEENKFRYREEKVFRVKATTRSKK